MTWQRSHNLDMEELRFEARSSDTNINENSNIHIKNYLILILFWCSPHWNSWLSPFIDCVSWVAYLTFSSLVFSPVKWELVVMSTLENTVRIQ